MRFGRYEVRGLLGAGGFASVYLARMLDRPGRPHGVALKRIHPRFATDGDAIARVLDEARITGALEHPNVRRLVDVLRVAGEPILVLEWVEGLSLSELLGDREVGKPVPETMARRLLLDTLSGLVAIHETRLDDSSSACLLHRDISPHNLLVGVDGRVRIVDFGVATAELRGLVAGPNGIRGKRAYMAPEHLAGQPGDARLDLFSLGIVALELFSGHPRRALEGGETGVLPTCESLSRHIENPALRAWCMKSVSPKTEGRFASARDMASALRALGESASHRDVGTWVREIGGESLAAQRHALEAAEALAPAKHAHHGSTRSFSATAASAPDAVARAPWNRRRRRHAYAVGALGVIGAMGMFSWLWIAPRMAKKKKPGDGADMSAVPMRVKGPAHSGKIDHATVCAAHCGELDLDDGAGGVEHILCVPCPAGPPPSPTCGDAGRYHVAGHGLWDDRVLDTHTRLVWTRTRMHDESLPACEGGEGETGGRRHTESFCCQSDSNNWARCNFAGAKDSCLRRGQRLPSIDELASIVGPNHSFCAFDSWWSWASTPSNLPDTAWHVGFQGDLAEHDSAELHRFRCVLGP